MGLEREDHFKRLKKMQGVDAILADVADLIDAHGLKLEEVSSSKRSVTSSNTICWASKPLPLGGASVTSD